MDPYESLATELLDSQREMLKLQQEKIVWLQAKSAGASSAPPQPTSSGALPTGSSLLQPTVYPSGEGRTRKDLIPGDFRTEGCEGVGFFTPEVLPDRLLKKIKDDAYVDFGEILSKPETRYAVAAPEDGDQSLKFTMEPQAKKITTPEQWNMAFDRYALAYAEAFPEAAMDLLVYGAFIRSLMVKPGVWLWYDERFRKERKAKGLPFCVIDRNLLSTVERLVPGLGAGEPAAGRKRKHGMPGGGEGPIGLCWAFNTTRCFFINCKYAHRCFTCKGEHPESVCQKKPDKGNPSSSAYKDRAGVGKGKGADGSSRK